MKIDPNDGILKNAHPGKNGQKETSIDKGFGEILKESIENASNVGSEAQKPAMINDVSKIQFHMLDPLEKLHIMDGVVRILDIFDEYQEKLGDPRVPLKDIHPLINKMEVETESLMSALRSLPEGDELKEILERVLITFTDESIKFNRGDYLAP